VPPQLDILVTILKEIDTSHAPNMHASCHTVCFGLPWLPPPIDGKRVEDHGDTAEPAPGGGGGGATAAGAGQSRVRCRHLKL